MITKALPSAAFIEECDQASNSISKILTTHESKKNVEI